MDCLSFYNNTEVFVSGEIWVTDESKCWDSLLTNLSEKTNFLNEKEIIELYNHFITTAQKT